MDGKVFLLPRLPQALGGPWHTPTPFQGLSPFLQQPGPQRDPLWSRTLFQPLGSDSQERNQGTLPLKREFFCLWLQRRGEPLAPTPPRELPSGLPLISAHLGFWNQKLLAHNHLVCSWLGGVQRV